MTPITIQAKLALAMFVARGGRGRQDQIIADCMQWERENGPVTEESLARWKSTSPENAFGMIVTKNMLDANNSPSRTNHPMPPTSRLNRVNHERRRPEQDAQEGR